MWLWRQRECGVSITTINFNTMEYPPQSLAARRNARNINIEVLRIISMLMIILGHTIGHSNAVNEAQGIVGFITRCLYVMIMPAVNVYVLISGYFLVTAKWNCKRVVLLWLQVFFYSLFFYMLAVLSGLIPLAPLSLIKALLPISGNQYWFARVFWCFTLLAPFAAILLRSLTKKQFQFFLSILVAMFCLWRMVLPFGTTVNVEGGNSIMWFFVLFAFAAYFRLHGNSGGEKKLSRWGWLYTVSALLSVSSVFALAALGDILGTGSKGTNLFTVYTSVTVLGMSLGLFMLFLRSPEWKLSDKMRRLILFFSGATYSVYLIHENIYVKKWLWEFVQPCSWLEGDCFLPLVAAAVLAIFFACALLDAVLWKPVQAVVNKCDFSRMQAKVDTLMNS